MPRLYVRLSVVAFVCAATFAQAQPSSPPPGLFDGPGFRNDAARDPFGNPALPARGNANPLAAMEALGANSGLGRLQSDLALDGGLKLETEARLGFSSSTLRLGLTDQADRFRMNGSIERRQDPSSFGLGAAAALAQPAANAWKLGFAGRVTSGILSFSSENDDKRGLRQNLFGYSAGLPAFAGGGRVHLLAGTRESRQLDPGQIAPTTLSFTDGAGRSGTLSFNDLKSTRVGALWAPGFLGGRTSLIATLDTVQGARVQGTEGRSDVYSRGGRALQMGVSRDIVGGNVYLGGMAGLTADNSVASRLMNLGLTVGRGIALGPARVQRFEMSVGQSGGVKFADMAGGTYVEHTRPERTAIAFGFGGSLGGGDASVRFGNQSLFVGFAAQFDSNLRLVKKAAGQSLAFGPARYSFFEGGAMPSVAAPAEQARLDQLERQLRDIVERRNDAQVRLAEARARVEALQARGIKVASADVAAAQQALVVAQAEAAELAAQAEATAGEIAAATGTATTEGALGTTAAVGGIGAGTAVAVAAAVGVAGAVTKKDGQTAAASVPALSIDNIPNPATVVNGQTKTMTITIRNLSRNFADAAAALAAIHVTLVADGGAVNISNVTINNFAAGTVDISYTGKAGFATDASDTYKITVNAISSNIFFVNQTAF